MNVYEYMTSLPRELFESTLLGLMGIPIGGEEEKRLHAWLDSPAEESFPLATAFVKGTPEEYVDSLLEALIGLCELGAEEMEAEATASTQ